VEAPPAPDNIFRGEVYFPYIPAGSESHADVELAFQKRGAYAQDEFGLSSKFPFSFLKKTRRLPWSARSWCTPRWNRRTIFSMCCHDHR